MPSKPKFTITKGLGWEQLLAQHIASHGLPAPKVEHVFAPPRKWRFDLAWPDRHLALEIDGGGFPSRLLGQGRHTRGAGFVADMEKQNAAALRGWRILRCTPSDVQAGRALDLVKLALRERLEGP